MLTQIGRLPQSAVRAQSHQSLTDNIVAADIVDLLLDVLLVLGTGLKLQFLIAFQHLGKTRCHID